MAGLLQNLSRNPEVDPGTVGIGFVDVLFALAVGEVFTPLQNYALISAAGWANITVGFTVIVLSWVGYHASHNRPRFMIRIVNIPMILLILDVLMVASYFLLEKGLQFGVHKGAQYLYTARFQAVFIAAVFGLYGLWDLLNLLMHGLPRYQAAWKAAQDDDTIKQTDVFSSPVSRAVVTGVFLLLATILALVAYDVGGMKTTSMIIFDAGLFALLVTYRLAKEAVTPHPVPASH